MTIGGAVIISLLVACVVLGLCFAGAVQSLDDMRKRLKESNDERDALSLELAKAREQASKVQKIEENRNEQKNAVAAGGFAASVGVLSDIARRGKPKA